MQEHFTRAYFDHKTVLVFGFGVNGGGLGTVEFLLGTGVAKVIVTDMKTEEELASTISQLPEDMRLEWHLGGHAEEDFRQADIVIKNPGIRWDNQYILLAQEYGARILMDSSIFMMLCEAPVIGITGSKGKTTTASLVAHILEVAGRKVVRVGISQTGVLSELAKVTQESVVVFEFSSWRLSALKEIEMSPQVAIMTNLHPDHLNYYHDMEEYAWDKAQIFAFQNADDVSVFSAENEWTSWFSSKAPSQKLFFGQTDEVDAWQDGHNLYVKQGGETHTLLDKQESFCQGEYLFANFLAASLGALSLDVDIKDIQVGLRTFRGVPHRFELVRELDGVQYINDTTATIPAASLASLRSARKDTILLAGGSDKGLPLEPLLRAIEEAQFTVLFSGIGTDKILDTLSPQQQEKCRLVNTMVEAVQVAHQLARPNQVVLLAPGAASFGMFRNEFDRGEQFIQQVNLL